MRRYRHDLSHPSLMAGQLGKLQTVSMVPVVAGDTLELNGDFVFRLSPQNTWMAFDVQVEVFCFYCKYRWYQDGFEDFIKQGVNESLTWDTVNLTGNGLGYLGQPWRNTLMPAWPLRMYNDVWRRNFRVPAQVASDNYDLDTIPADLPTRTFGQNVARLKAPWTTGVDDVIADTDHDVPVTGGTFDLVDMAEAQGVFASELDRQWWANRYTEMLGAGYDSYASIDADERPELLCHTLTTLGGYDVDGTGETNLGVYAGKSIGYVHCGFPRRFFNEHGAVLVMALLRPPLLHYNECHPLFLDNNPDYTFLSGDPKIWEEKAPEPMTAADWFVDGSAAVLGDAVYGQHYRYHPPVVHTEFQSEQGFALLFETPASAVGAWYNQDQDYDQAFRDTQLGHWQCQARLSMPADRVVPPAVASIKTGV